MKAILVFALLLPLFFTYLGLNTQIGLIDSAYLWAVAGVVLIVAIGRLNRMLSV